MRGLMRFLIMFGPMIFRQFQKYQAKKQRQIQQDPMHHRRRKIDEEIRNKEIQKSKAERKKELLSEEEKNFRMKEEEFMLDNTVHSENELTIDEIKEINENPIIEDIEDLDDNLDRKKSSPIQENKSFNIRDLFVKDVEE